MLYTVEPVLVPCEMEPIETFTDNELIAELCKRFEGFFVAGYKVSRCKGEYPPQVYWDTDLTTLKEIQDLGGEFFNQVAKEMSD